MSTFVDLLPGTLEGDLVDAEVVQVQEEVSSSPAELTRAWNLDSYVDEQVRGLVRRLFLPGWPTPCRQVVVSAVDISTDVSALCTQLGHALTNQSSGSACVVEIGSFARTENQELDFPSPQKRFGTIRDSSLQLADQLWFMPREVFLGGHIAEFSVVRLRSRLAELRLEFDYTILQGPSAAGSSAAALLGAQCDGIVIVVEANSTRRAAAQKVKEELNAANARLLGTVLSERTFPIPQAIYSRL